MPNSKVHTLSQDPAPSLFCSPSSTDWGGQKRSHSSQKHTPTVPEQRPNSPHPLALG